MSDQVPLEILIQIRDEIAGLNRARAGLQGAKKDADGLGTALRQGLGIGSGLAIATAGIALLNNTLRASAGEAFRLATEVTNMSKALDMSGESFQVMKDLIEDTGGEVGSLTMAVKEMRDALNQSGKGGGAADAFRTLKIDAEAFARLPVEGKLEMIAKATFNAENRTSALGAASEILGSRNLPKVTNALQALARDGYAKVAEEAKKAGQVMDDDAVRRLHEANLRIKNFKDSVTVATGQALAAADMVGDSAKKDFWGTAWDFLKGGPMGPISGDFTSRVAVDAVKNTPAAVPPLPPVPTLATKEDILRAELAYYQQEIGRGEGATYRTVGERRETLSGLYTEQERIMGDLLANRFPGDTGKMPFNKDGDITEDSLRAYRERNEMEAEYAQMRQKRIQETERPLAILWREMNDTTALIENTLTQGIGQGLNQLGADIWEAMKGTQAWGDAFRNLGNMAGRMLTQIITQMLVVKTINMALGFFGLAMSGAGPSIGKVGATTIKNGAGGDTLVMGSQVRAAGGGMFLTRGPTQFTVGDNPGGVELVSVRPISGIGQTMINGNRVAMAGGGNALAMGMGRQGDTFHLSYSFHGDARREEILALIPQMVESTKNAVLDATRRRRDGFR